MKFVDWDHRPAVLLDGDTAFAVLRPGAAWTSVDASDVGHTGADLSETAWRRMFEGKFGSLVWPPAPGYSSVGALVMAQAQKPTAKDFDDAALAVHASYLKHKALQAIKLGLSELPEE
jgi:hypothetical protein